MSPGHHVVTNRGRLLHVCSDSQFNGKPHPAAWCLLPILVEPAGEEEWRLLCADLLVSARALPQLRDHHRSIDRLIRIFFATQLDAAKRRGARAKNAGRAKAKRRVGSVHPKTAEVLRLKRQRGLSNRAIQEKTGVDRRTVARILSQADPKKVVRD